ncbi:MAG: flagellar biosynthesis protein FliQ [Ruminococcaceae bacterium]|nr:flagellar biosynthesis protein FliQ [Oscillospiraceae bacterium]
MSNAEIMDLMRQVLMVCLQIVGPLLIASIVVGLIVAIFQAATQIHEQTLTFVPKLLVIGLLLLLLGSWIYALLGGFFTDIFNLMASV